MINPTVPDAKHTIAIEGGGLLEQAVRRVGAQEWRQPLTTSTTTAFQGREILRS
jgi:hypothetical protein